MNINVPLDQKASNASSTNPVHYESTKAQIKTKRMETVLNELNIAKVDLIKINIEGGEYDLLEDMFNSDLMSKFINIQIQFHIMNGIKDYRRQYLRERINRTHVETYCYPYVWENWRLQ